jgi:hypothetical protein
MGGYFMKRLLFLFIIVIMVFGLVAGCGPSFDEEGLTYINNYVDEIIPAILLGLASFELYFAACFENLPYEEGLQNIKDSADEITKVNKKYWTNEFPDIEEVKKWSFIRKIGHPVVEEWTIDGNELAEALLDIKNTSTSYAGALQEVYLTGENWTDHLTSPLLCRDDVKKSLERLQWLLFRKE